MKFITISTRLFLESAPQDIKAHGLAYVYSEGELTIWQTVLQEEFTVVSRKTRDFMNIVKKVTSKKEGLQRIDIMTKSEKGTVTESMTIGYETYENSYFNGAIRASSPEEAMEKAIDLMEDSGWEVVE